ncbi:MAG: TlpA family protein disulfide reductase [Gammaproteobacteria bacterium]|nr:TlpA family protein disulfide reductase [Gammaproteobacteria bacterium]
MQKICSSIHAARRFLSVLVISGALTVGAHAATEDFTLPDLDGQQHSLSDYRGRWVLVNYWATWCPPCLEEIPELEVFHTGSEGKAIVLGVNMESIDDGELKQFVDQQFVSYPILLATERPSREQLIGPVEGLPTSYLVSPSGEIVARQVGQVTAQGIQSFIENYESAHPGEVQ